VLAEDDLGVASDLYWKPPQSKGLTQIIRILEKKFNKKRPFARILEFILIVGPTSPKSQTKESK